MYWHITKSIGAAKKAHLHDSALAFIVPAFRSPFGVLVWLYTPSGREKSRGNKQTTLTSLTNSVYTSVVMLTVFPVCFRFLAFCEYTLHYNFAKWTEHCCVWISYKMFVCILQKRARLYTCLIVIVLLRSFLTNEHIQYLGELTIHKCGALLHQNCNHKIPH